MTRSCAAHPVSESTLEHIARRVTGATAARIGARLQTLWGGYGAILRVDLSDATVPSVIVKHVTPPPPPRGGRSSEEGRSHERKLRSYRVETHWYTGLASRCGLRCRVPRALHCEEHGAQWVLVLEDLDVSGFPRRSDAPTTLEIEACLRWLAHFHATFLDVAPDGLWRRGTYWHLATRPDELRRTTDPDLRILANRFDEALGRARFRTLVHGDAKSANFCFGGVLDEGGCAVAALDFQYVGGGCGVQDVAYFFSSIWSERECQRSADGHLATYFSLLREALLARHDPAHAEAVIDEWSALFPVAWADFQRFLDGWSPGTSPPGPYGRRQLDLARQAVTGRAPIAGALRKPLPG